MKIFNFLRIKSEKTLKFKQIPEKINGPKIVQNQYFSTKIDAIDAEKREESKNKIKIKKNTKK